MRFLTVFPLFLLVLAGSPGIVPAQELNIDVTLDRSQIDDISLDYLDDFPDEVESYLNDHDWIDEIFRDQEQITGDMQIILTSADNDNNFEATVIVRTRRPIYNTLRETNLFLFNDENWSFTYTPNRSLTHDELQFDPVATLLDFYAYVMLGFDFDSFSELGGSPYYSEAQKLVSLAQTVSSTGWSRSGGNRRNRAQFIRNLQHPNYEEFRRAIYLYHREGIDRFISDTRKARRSIIESLKLIRDAQDQATDNFLFNTFFNAKYREIVSIFEDAPTDTRLEAYNLLSNIDQGHLSTYRKLQ